MIITAIITPTRLLLFEYICLPVCIRDNSKSVEPIFLKFCLSSSENLSFPSLKENV